MIPPKGDKGQNVSYFQNILNAISPTDYIVCSGDLFMYIT